MASPSDVSSSVMAARLDECARYHLQNKTPHDATLAALREVGAPPEIVREAADSARTAYLADPIQNWQSGDVARLLDWLR